MMTLPLQWFMGALGYLPMPVLHVLSSGVAFLLQNVFRYRKETIRKNLKICFPEWSEEKISEIEKKYYLHLSDLILEMIKTTHISRDEAHKRCVYVGENPVPELYAAGKNAVGCAYHFGSWEWMGLSYPELSKHTFLTVYKPLSNKKLDRWIRKPREQFGQKMVSYREIARYLKTLNGPVAVALVADQHPHIMENSIEVIFFGKRMRFFHGPATFAVLKGWTPLLAWMKKAKRSYYTWGLNKPILPDIDPKLEAEQIERLKRVHAVDDIQALKMIAFTQAYVKQLEEMIREQPELWLWSHRRWR